MLLIGVFEEGRNSGLDPEGSKKGALRHRAEHRSTACLPSLTKRSEIDLRGEIGKAWVAQRINRLMMANRLERIAGRTIGPGTIIDDKGHPAISGETLAQRHRKGMPCRTNLGDLPNLSIADDHVDQRWWRIVRPETKAPILKHRNKTFPPASFSLHQLMHRQRINKLVGDQEQRAFGHSF